MYLIKYNHHDSYPEVLGVETLDSIRYPNAITSKRQQLGEILDKLDDQYESDEDDDFGVKLSKHRPANDLFIEWIYEIDLDRSIFHINGIPFFDLECLPDTAAFLEYVSGDHYGHTTCPPTCPPEQKYKRPVPPVVDDYEVATYQSLVCTGTEVALSDLLAISDVLSPDEHVRVSLLETIIGQCMARPDVAGIIQDLWLVPGPRQLTNDFWLTAFSMANITFLPQMFDSGVILHPAPTREEFTWVRKDIVLYVSTHLDNERCLNASLSRLINVILEQKDNAGDYFGVAFSIFHCAIVKVVKDAHSVTFSHTAALDFLPSFYADYPSTPGIAALARLGYRIDPELFVRATEIFRRPGAGGNKGHTDDGTPLAQGADNVSPTIGCPMLPPELWQEVALNLHLPDLLTFGLVSKSCRELASIVLRYPHICGYRLVTVAKEKPERMMHGYLYLRVSCFSTKRAGIPATVLVGMGSDRRGPGSRIGIDIPFCYPHTTIHVRVSAEVQPQATAKEKTLTSLEMEIK
ncbi:hypothetical protein AZE42_06547 [Rhizopogon vesiculosus]|uniref:F-box domain-containing protein n=1 Tax=Rhizopogon vesiculosus TaxID=180088 RepID=A0A1J8QG99_9AGAM|nr:hypothetical protein AZE42_06547 [Rhizopogon vesiculosus]